MKTKGLLLLGAGFMFFGFPLCGITAEKQPEPVDYKLALVWMADGASSEKYEYIFTINNGVGFKTLEKLKEYIAGLPKGSKLTWSPGCIRMGGEPLLSSEKDLEEFKSFCKSAGVNLIIVPAG